MGAHTPGPENAEKQENGADDLANPTHSLKTIPADVLARVARTKLQRRLDRGRFRRRPGGSRLAGRRSPWRWRSLPSRPPTASPCPRPNALRSPTVPPAPAVTAPTPTADPARRLPPWRAHVQPAEARDRPGHVQCRVRRADGENDVCLPGQSCHGAGVPQPCCLGPVGGFLAAPGRRPQHRQPARGQASPHGRAHLTRVQQPGDFLAHGIPPRQVSPPK